MRALCVALCIVFTAQPAVAKNYTFTARPLDSQTVEYFQGTAVTISRMPETSITVSYDGRYDGKRAAFLVTIENAGDDINIDTPNVTAVYDSATLHVYTADELVEKAERKAAWASLAVAAVGGLQAAAATQPTTATTYGHVGNTSYSSTTKIYGTNYFAQARAQSDTNQALDRVAAARNDKIDSINDDYLRINTLKTGTVYRCRIVIDQPKQLTDAPLELQIVVGNDTHKFDFGVGKMR